MRKYLKITLFLLGLLIVPLASVHAQDFDGDHDIRMDTDNDFDIHPYVGGGFGAFGLELKGAGINQKNTVFGGFGKVGLDIGDYLGAELRVGSTSSGTAGNMKLSDSYFISYLAKIQFPVTLDFKPYAMLGGTTAKFNVTDAGVETSNTRTGFSYGFGAEYYVQGSLSVGGEWMQYWTNVNLTANRKAKIWGAVVTVNYHF